MNSESKENKIIIEHEGKKHELCEYMFGALKMDHSSPLCCVSEANNSFSIDYYKGCSFQCAYCHVQGIYEDLDENYKMYKSPRPRSNFSIQEIIDELIRHPYFVKDKSIISIATSSTEPFANPETTNKTLEIMEYFVSQGYKNPFWIVTKAGIPKGIQNRLKNIIDHGNKTMISICWANNPREIEPAQSNRFKNIETLKDTGVCISWYLRPLVKEWGANKDNLEEMIKTISEKYYDYIDMIVPGGLRWTEGIEFGLNVMRKLEMPDLVKENNKKTLSNEIEINIKELCQKYFPKKPVYFNSSCAVSHMLNRTNIAMLNIFDKSICEKSNCTNCCKKSCENITFTREDLDFYEKKLKEQEIDIRFESIDFENKIKSFPEFNSFDYSERQQIRKTIELFYNERNKADESK